MSDVPTGIEDQETWALLEIMGHDRIAGLVATKAIGTAAIVEVRVPATTKYPAFRKLFAPAAIFSMTPVSENVAREMAERFGSRPHPQLFYPGLPALPAPEGEPGTTYFGDEELFDDDDYDDGLLQSEI